MSIKYAQLQTPTTTTQTLFGGSPVIVPQSLTFPFSPNDLNWNYKINKLTRDTYGGRVTQLLSVKIDTMVVTGDCGSRTNLMAFYAGLKQLQTTQITNRIPLTFFIPSSDPMNPDGSSLTFNVWIHSMEIGWDPTAVTYPYNVMFEVADDSYGAGYGYASLITLVSSQVLKDLFAGTSNGIDYGNVGTTNLSAYYSGTLPAARYGGAQTASKSDLTTPTGLGSH